MGDMGNDDIPHIKKLYSSSLLAEYIIYYCGLDLE